MNRDFTPTSTAIRSTFVAAAVLATVLVAASIDRLAGHYTNQAQWANARPGFAPQRSANRSPHAAGAAAREALAPTGGNASAIAAAPRPTPKEPM